MFCEPTFSGKLTQEMTNKRDLIGSQKRANQRLSIILGRYRKALLAHSSGHPRETHTPNTLSQTKWLVRPRPRAFPSPPRPGRRRRARTARDSRRAIPTRLPFLVFFGKSRFLESGALIGQNHCRVIFLAQPEGVSPEDTAGCQAHAGPLLDATRPTRPRA